MSEEHVNPAATSGERDKNEADSFNVTALIAEARTIARHSAVSLPEHAECLDNLADALSALRAERDAALAAIERVRAAHTGPTWAHFDLTLEQPHEKCDGCTPLCLCANVWPCPTTQALDGAPEPEWEWGAMWPNSCTGEPSVWGNREESIRKEIEGNPGMHLVRRRKAGPWLPVGGESND